MLFRSLQRQRDRAALSVVSPAEGQVIPPAKVADEAVPGELSTWRDRPLASCNLGASMEAGVLLCYVGDPRKLEAVIDIDQSEVDFVAAEQDVKFKFASLPADTFNSRIVQVAQLERETGGKPAAEDPYGKALTTKYQASAHIDDGQGLINTGATGTARIRAGYQTIGQRVWRYVSQTFRFRS